MAQIYNFFILFSYRSHLLIHDCYFNKKNKKEKTKYGLARGASAFVTII